MRHTIPLVLWFVLPAGAEDPELSGSAGSSGAAAAEPEQTEGRTEVVEAPADEAPQRQVGGKESIEWVRIPGGAFPMGSTAGSVAEASARTVHIPSFELMKTEVTVGQYGACVAAGACTAPNDQSTAYCNWGHAEREDHPVNCVDWDQAQAFARWVGGRLPSEAEWEYAARSGGTASIFPWGDEMATCSRVVMDDGGGGCGKDRTWPVCSKSAGHSAQGVCDLSGNVWEWVQDGYRRSYSGAPEDGSAWEGDVPLRVFRGGGWRDPAGRLRASYRSGIHPARRSHGLGFRLAR
jgi:iron(II)-dependent oxidoreductase